MDSKQFLKDMYDDFFNIEKIKNEKNTLESKIRKQIEEESKGAPKIEIKMDDIEETNQNLENSEDSEMDINDIEKIKDEKMLKAFEEIDLLYITEESKEILKKMIEYMRKYGQKIEKEYIPFNINLCTDNRETAYLITTILDGMATFFGYIEGGETVEVSLYNLEKTEQAEEIYKDKNTIILLKDFEGIIAQEQIFKDKFWHRVEEKIKDSKTINILMAKNREIINQAFEKNEEILERNFDFEIRGINPDIQDIYQEVLNRLKENTNVSSEFSIKLLDYIAATYPNTTLSYPEYRDKLCKKILFNKGESLTIDDLPEYEKEKTIEEIFGNLNELVGLNKVKEVLHDLVNLIELKNKTKDELKIQDTNLHMVFLGNPGTGKTTVARIVAEILYNLKYIKQNKLIEVSSKDLVAEYVGQTGPKTMAVIQKALGGVLFIDEAYSLASGQGQGNSYNEEAIATLIQAMENYRDNLVVIFAGYTKEMQSFLNANSGIVSRIGYTIEFEDYSEEELLKIFNSMITKSGFSITNEANEEVLKIIKDYKDTKNFGNARFVRNLYEKTIIKHASNTKEKKNKKVLKTIQKEDISVENLLKM